MTLPSFLVFAFLLLLFCGLQVVPSLPSHCQGTVFLLLLHLCPLLFCCLSASLPSLILLATQLCLLAGAFLCRRSFPRSHLLTHLFLLKFSCNCWTRLLHPPLLPKKPLHPPTTFAYFELGGQFCCFPGLVLFFDTIGQGFWVLLPFQINTDDE